MVKYLYIFLITLCSLQALAQKNTNSLEFVENKGQWDKSVSFMSDLGNGAFYLQKSGFKVLQHNSADLMKLAELTHGHAHDKNGSPRYQGADGQNPSGKSFPLQPLEVPAGAVFANIMKNCDDTFVVGFHLQHHPQRMKYIGYSRPISLTRMGFGGDGDSAR